MEKIKSKNKIDGLKASITVETTLIMPIVLACIILLIVMNGYLHDMVILNGISAEVLYADMEDREKIFYEETQKRSLWLQNVEFAETEDLFNRTVTWKQTFSLPLKGMLSMVTGESQIDLSGSIQKSVWSMPQIIRYVKQN